MSDINVSIYDEVVNASIESTTDINVSVILSDDISVNIVDEVINVSLLDDIIINATIIDDLPISVIAIYEGPQGEPGYSPPKGPAFTYTGSELTGITYDDGSTKVLSYTGGKLIQVVFVQGLLTSTKTFNYTGDILMSIDEVIT